MKIIELLRNPIIKSIGIALILYFALFANKQHPKSLGNRLSSENLKKDLTDATSKGKFIVDNIQMAKKLTQDKKLQTISTTPYAEIIHEDLEIGSGDRTLACGDDAEISYGFYTATGQQLDFVSLEKVTIGSTKKVWLEQNIAGMKLSGIRYIIIPKNITIADSRIMQLLQQSGGNLRIQVTLLSFTKSSIPNISCN